MVNAWLLLLTSQTLFPKAELLHLPTTEIQGPILLYGSGGGACSVCCRMFNGLYPVDASSHPQLWQPKPFPDIAKRPLRGKTSPRESHCPEPSELLKPQLGETLAPKVDPGSRKSQPGQGVVQGGGRSPHPGQRQCFKSQPLITQPRRGVPSPSLRVLR